MVFRCDERDEKEMKKLICIAANILIGVTILCLIISVTTSAPVVNDIYIDQLNGGDGEYITMQLYQKYQNESANLKATIVALAMFWFSANIIYFIASRKK